MEKNGKPLAYTRTDAQAQAARDNVAANPEYPKTNPDGKPTGGGKPNSRDNSKEPKGKSKGKGNNKPCLNWTETGACRFGESCSYRANTPGHP